MKIALVTPYPVGTDGGVQKHVRDFAKKLEEFGHYVRVFSPSSTEETQDLNHTTLGKYRIVRGGKYTNKLLSNGSRTFYTTLGKDSKVLPEEFDIIHVHEPLLPLFFFSNAIINANNASCIATVHAANSLSEDIRPYLQKILKRYFMQKFEHIIAVSEVSTSLYRGMGIPMSIIPNGVDSRYFHPKVEKLKEYQDGLKNVLFLGRFDPRKGVEYLLKAWPEITKAMDNKVRLILVRGGSPEENAKVFKIIDTLPNKENIVFEGFVTEDRKRQLLKTADVLVAPSIGGEAQGIVLNEAMACGTPVLGYANPGYAGVLWDKADYCLAEVKNVEDLAQKTVRILTDDKLAMELSNWGREEVLKKYEWDVITKKILKVYENTLENKKRNLQFKALP